MYQIASASGVEALEVLPGKVLLAIAEVDGVVNLRQFRQRGEIRKDRALSILGGACGRCSPARGTFQSR